MELFRDNDQKDQFISNYQNPFSPEKVRKIEFTIENNIWGDRKTEYKSLVSFNNGDTSGYHRIKADSFVDIINQTEAFIKSLG